MKKFFALLFVVALVAAPAFAGWEFVKEFPDSNFRGSLGAHGVAVDPAGKVWLQIYGATDSIFDVTQGAYRVCRKIYVYNPDGTPASFHGFKIITGPGFSDTIYNSSRGMRTDPDGNVVFVSFNTYYKVDYQTGAGLLKLDHEPTVPAGVTGIAPGFTSANEMITGPVIPGTAIKIWDNAFTYYGNVVDQSVGYSRSVNCSPDGNDVYWTAYSLNTMFRYHSDNGTLGPYAFAESLMTGFAAEVSGWNKKDGWLYVGGGNGFTPNPDPRYSNYTYYALDVVTKEIKDSIKWNLATGGADPRPRGIDFSPGGDTAYIIQFNEGALGSCQMFRRLPSSVEQIKNMVPSEYKLGQNYPNPFNPSTTIEFEIPRGGMTTVKVFDVLGKEVATLVNESLAPGAYKTKLDGSRLSSGTYIYTLSSGGNTVSKKMLLVK